MLDIITIGKTTEKNFVKLLGQKRAKGSITLNTTGRPLQCLYLTVRNLKATIIKTVALEKRFIRNIHSTPLEEAQRSLF